jgi:predicted MPP superfamily phosphohydrolase
MDAAKIKSAELSFLKSNMIRIESDVSVLSELEEDEFVFQEIQIEEKSSFCVVEEMAASSSATTPSRKMSSSFEIQILSDVHTEFLACDKKRAREFYDRFDDIVSPSAKYLALLGDIGCPGTQEGFVQFQEFISRLEGKFERVFLVAGNHEFYCKGHQRMHMEEIKHRLRKFCKRKEFVTFLDKESFVCGREDQRVRIVGCTLWSDVSCDPEVESAIVNTLADFRNIFVSDSPWDPEKYCSLRSMLADDVRRMHQEDVQFIISEVAEASKNGESVVILTHHAPSFRGTSPPEYSSGPDQSSKSHKYSTAFASELDHLLTTPEFQKSVRAWGYGHTHHSNRQTIEGVELVSNQIGYLHKNENCVHSKSCVIRF